jgi:integrase
MDPFDALLEHEPVASGELDTPPLPAAIERYVLGELERERARLRELRRKGLGAENTLRAYRADWRVFTAWCASNNVNALPALPDDVARYVRYLFDRPRRTVTDIYERNGKTVTRTIKEGPAHPKTIARHLLTIRKAHRLLGLSDPTAHQDVKLTVAGLRRERGVASNPKTPIEQDRLSAAITALDEQAARERDALERLRQQRPDDRRLNQRNTALQLRIARDRAILMLGWSGALRRSEIVALDRGDLRLVPQGVEITLRRSKTNQEGEHERIGIPYAPANMPCAVRALIMWLDLAPPEGAVFRYIDRHGVIRDRLRDAHVNRIAKASAAAIGLREADFGAHSLRAGWITTAGRQNVPEERAMRHSRHQSISIYRSYIRRASLWDDHPSLQLFDDAKHT